MAVESLGRHALEVRADALAPEAVDAAIARAVDRFGHVDVAVNTVGGTHAPKAFLDLDVDEWHSVVNRNALATFVSCRSEARWMVDHDVAGSIVNIASLSGVAGAPNAADYGAANAAVVALHGLDRARAGAGRHPGELHRPRRALDRDDP